MTRFERAIAGAAFLTNNQMGRIMRNPEMRNLVEAARAAPPSRVTLLPAVYELLHNSVQHNAANGVQLQLPDELIPQMRMMR